jgi:hypothetical protein
VGVKALAELVKKHGADLGARLDSLRVPQKQEIADQAYEHGFLPVMEALAVPIASLERCMREAGYAQCAGECEAWFGELELTDGRCGDCSDSEGFAEHQRELRAQAEEAARLAAEEAAKPVVIIPSSMLEAAQAEFGSSVRLVVQDKVEPIPEPASPTGN